LLCRFVGGRHDDVSFAVLALVALQPDSLRHFVPRHELAPFLVQDRVFRWLLRSALVHVEADHASNEVLANLLLPSFVWSAQCNLHSYFVPRIQFQQELGVVHPGELIWLLFKFFVV